ncbi:uncharacterized protein E0L32_006933 [Thyridium curvatum]|uniref:Uncharacterized protein n=1 Tax=Thyridium curvatum TaxID=1093900 RepID=A0A507AZP5_9PEZI|nr:uncharacterized protein E0L32_006933 [Thyridium curvatum]TPX12286.1 hypothetical protein E0L32_006933 [Thyridium curvatum]
MAHQLPHQLPQNLPQPDFVVIRPSLDDLGTQLPRLVKIPAAQQDVLQQILARLDAVEIRLTSIETRAENERLRKQNAHRLASDRHSILLPLLDLRTGRRSYDWTRAIRSRPCTSCPQWPGRPSCQGKTLAQVRDARTVGLIRFLTEVLGELTSGVGYISHAKKAMQMQVGINDVGWQTIMARAAYPYALARKFGVGGLIFLPVTTKMYQSNRFPKASGILDILQRIKEADESRVLLTIAEHNIVYLFGCFLVYLLETL